MIFVYVLNKQAFANLNESLSKVLHSVHSETKILLWHPYAFQFYAQQENNRVK